MGTANTFESLDGHFKEIYAEKIKDLIPEGTVLYNMFDFMGGSTKLGNQYHQPVTLTLEHGFTYGGNAGNAYALNAAIANANADAVIKGHEITLRSIISKAAISRSMSDKGAFVRETKFKVENMMKSFVRRLEVQLMYGQVGIGAIATSGVTGNVLTIAAAEWAPGIWGGSEGMRVDVYNGTTKRGTAAVSAVAISTRKVTLDTLPVGTTDADVLYYEGSKDAEFAGIHKIITNTGTLFGIDAGSYSLWSGNTVNVGTDATTNAAELSFDKVEEGIAIAQGKGLVEQKVCLICNPFSWKNLLTEQDAKRRYDSSYSAASLDAGSEVIKFYSQNGVIEIKSSIYCKEGFAYLVAPDCFMRIGSSDIVFGLDDGVLGTAGKFIRLMEDVNGYEMRAYTDQALFCNQPGINTLLNFIKK